MIEGVPQGFALPGDSGRIELPDTADGYIAAVVCRRPDGSFGWQALAPDGDRDAWVAVHLEGESVVANSWSGWCVRLDSATGDEENRHFTK